MIVLRIGKWKILSSYSDNCWTIHLWFEQCIYSLYKVLNNISTLSLWIKSLSIKNPFTNKLLFVSDEYDKHPNEVVKNEELTYNKASRLGGEGSIFNYSFGLVTFIAIVQIVARFYSRWGGKTQNPTHCIIFVHYL